MDGERCRKKNNCSNYPNECHKCGALSDLRHFYPCFQDKDIVKVVRCKDCKHCKKDSHCKELYCLKMSDDEHTHWLDKDFYCSYGERREE